jgi:HD superfamily phosphodiesterase
MKLFISKLLHYVLLATKKENIDETHAMSHSLNVINYAYRIFEDELTRSPRLISDQKIIIASAALHDMCDHKYMNETEGVENIVNYLNKETDMSLEEIAVTKNIITTMSYSKVKVNGFPEMGKYKKAYDIVREADLLCSYDFDRAMIYDIIRNNRNLKEAYDESYILFKKRMFMYCNDNLFVHDLSKKEAYKLHAESLKRIDNWRRLLQHREF